MLQNHIKKRERNNATHLLIGFVPFLIQINTDLVNLQEGRGYQQQ
jgi:hypothetical protein